MLSFVDGIPQIKVDLVWESEPKYIGKHNKPTIIVCLENSIVLMYAWLMSGVCVYV